MEGQQQSPNEDGGSGKRRLKRRQRSNRWTPTTDQIRILKELFYEKGITSPSVGQVHGISATLRQYGKIEAKSVFYWFQNQKARESKKRITSDVPMQRGPTNTASAWKHEEPPIHTTNPNIASTGVSYTPSSAGMVIGHIGKNGYVSVPMEISFKECSISAGGSSGHVGGAMIHNLGYFGMGQYSSAYPTFFDKIMPIGKTMEEEQVEDSSPEIQTLPLFPVHREDIHDYCNLRSNSSNSVGGWYQTEEGFMNGSRASLELSLNSYTRKSPGYS